MQWTGFQTPQMPRVCVIKKVLGLLESILGTSYMQSPRLDLGNVHAWGHCTASFQKCFTNVHFFRYSKFRLLQSPWMNIDFQQSLKPTDVKSSKISLQSNLYLRTQLVKNGRTYYKKYLNQGMDSHNLTCKVVHLVNDLLKKIAKFDKPLYM
jgi:hypothetical protein